MPDRDRTTEVYTLPAELRAASTVAPPIRAAGRLVCVVGYQAGQVFTIGSRPTTIGRGGDADICLDGVDISRAHARIEWRDGEFVLEDLGSRNGTSVNGLPIQTRILQIGDRLQFGSSVMLIYAQHDELEQRALRLQKLEGLAQLAGGMVHDFRNTLAIIGMNAELLAEALGKRASEDPDLLQSVQDIRAACDATAELTQRLLYFSRRDATPELVKFGLLGLVEDVMALVRRTFESAGIRVTVDVDPRLEIRGQRGDLHHALLNLCFNARDAMAGGGKLTIRAAAVRFGQSEALQRHLPCPGAFIELSVTDTGSGIDERILARVFEPFFTTKPSGEGTGLGLSTVYRVACVHGGSVDVESRPGHGASFRVLLPDATTRD